MPEQPAESVPESRVDEIIDSAYIEERKMGNKTLVVCAVLPNKFEVIGTAAPVDLDDFDRDQGRKIALGEIRDKVWELLGAQLHSDL